MKRFTLGLLAACALAGMSASAAFADTIDFSTLTGANSDPFASYSEGAFSVNATTGSWFDAFNTGNPVPAIYLGPDLTPAPGSVTITGGQFDFSSADFASINGGTTYTITGYLNGTEQFSQTGLLPASRKPAGFPFTTISSTSSLTLDTLVISLSSLGPNVQAVNLDNIVVNPVTASVPEPVSWALMIMGFAGLGEVMRRRKVVRS